jgi:hypothetical protein
VQTKHVTDLLFSDTAARAVECSVRADEKTLDGWE